MKIAVIGSGSWGTALADYMAWLGNEVSQWVRESDVLEDINSRHQNRTFLPGVTLNENLTAVADIAEAVAEAQYIISVVPTQFLRAVAEQMSANVPSEALIISASKGIENESLKSPSQIYLDVIGEEAADRICVLAGPSFAKEVARRHPTTVVAAARQADSSKQIQHDLSSDVLRIYSSQDVLGTELCGAVKNVIALASGAVAGMGLGDNTRAALITRGVSEISRLVRHLGGSARTVAGMAGVGDMVLTCTSDTSRNYTVGFRLGSGEKLEDIIDSMKMVAEGVRTTQSVAQLARKHNVDMPICMAMHAVLYEGLEPRIAARNLMTRELKEEWDTELQ